LLISNINGGMRHPGEKVADTGVSAPWPTCPTGHGRLDID